MTVQIMRRQAGDFSEAEWQARVELAACYRIADRNRMSKVVWNHITARIPGEENLLINRFGLRYDEITASNLVKIDPEGKPIDGTPEELNFTGYVIHSAVHQASRRRLRHAYAQPRRPDDLCAEERPAASLPGGDAVLRGARLP